MQSFVLTRTLEAGMLKNIPAFLFSARGMHDDQSNSNANE
jgi:hypothetical protein